MSTGKYIRVSPDLDLYYEEAGTGRPIIFIPGWAGTTEFYAHQMPYFAQHYRALTYDPRSQGRSSRTLENNHYQQHGQDLKAFLDALGIEDVILVALSAGCFDIYAYVRAYGTVNLKACVFIDTSPRSIGTQPGDWCWVSDAAEIGGIVQAVMHDMRGFVNDLIPPMYTRAIWQKEMAWALDQLTRTPVYAATLTILDASLADYAEEARLLDGKIPVLNIVAEPDEAAARTWLAANAPHSEIFVLGKHLMLLEFPDEFNAAVGAFLKRVG